MFQTEPRPTFGPMDLDEPERYGRIAQFAVSDHEEGPSRKRPHGDLVSPTWSGASQPSGLRYDASVTPFMFHASRLPQTPEKPWSSVQPHISPGHLGFSSSSHYEAATGVEDVEMAETPDRPPLEERSPNLPPYEGLSSGSPACKPVILHAPPDIELDTGSDGHEQDALASRPIATGGMKRELKRRAQRRDRRRYSQSRETLRTENHYTLHTPAPALHPSEIPSLLSRYVRSFVDSLMALLVLYIVFYLVTTMTREIHGRVRELSDVVLQDISECTRHFVANRCDSDLLVPALVVPCRKWQECIDRDPTNVRRMAVIAEIFGDIFDSFVRPMSFKTVTVTLAALTVLLVTFLKYGSRETVREPYNQQYPYNSQGIANWDFAPQLGSSLDPDGQSLGERQERKKGHDKWWRQKWRRPW